MNSVKYCTLFSLDYALQGLTLVGSLIDVGVNPEDLWILCLDDLTYEIVQLQLPPEVNSININNDQEIKEKFSNYLNKRSRSESIFSIKPLFVGRILRALKQDEWVIYVDADSFFYTNCSSLAQMPTQESILLSPHFYPTEMNQNVGKFNAGFVGFKKSDVGLDAVDYWTQACSQWCSVKKENGLYADQKYLEFIQNKWTKETAFTPKGINFSTWSFSKDSKIVQTQEGRFMIDDIEIIHFHFHGFRHSRFLSILGINRYEKLSDANSIKKLLYQKYMNQLSIHRRKIDRLGLKHFFFEKTFIPSSVNLRFLFHTIRVFDIALNKKEMVESLKRSFLR
jgi:hypothetical protein